MMQLKSLNCWIDKRRKRGFTLIEIMVVVAIIAILATLIIVSVVGSQRKARDTKRTADANSMITAIGQYKESSGVYPIVSCGGNTICPFSGAALDPYLGSVPKDPKTKNGYLYQSDGTNYQIYVTYESDVKGGVTTTTVPGGSGYYVCRVGSDTSKYSDEASNNTPVCK